MNKGLEALEKVRKARYMFAVDNQQACDVIEKELKALEIIRQKGIAFLVPNSDYSNEHIHIDIYTNTLSKEELEMVKEVLGLW